MHLPKVAQSVLEAWRRLRPLVGGSWAKPIGLVASSMATGLVEAALLALIAQSALALSRGGGSGIVEVGPLTFGASIQVLIASAAVLALGRLALQAFVSWAPARIASDVQYHLQTELFRAYCNADWPSQAADRDGHLQELISSHVLRVAYAVLIATGGIASLFSLIALVAAALAISPITALLLAGAALGMFLLLRPLAQVVRRFNQQVSSQSLHLAGGTSEAARLAEETHVFGAAEDQVRRFRKVAEGLREPFFRAQLAGRLVPAAYQSVTLLLLVGGLAIIAAVETPHLATLGTVVLILVRSLGYGQQVQGVYTELTSQLPFVDRVQQAMERYGRQITHSGSAPLQRIENLVLQDIDFAYTQGQGPLVLEAVTAMIPAGQVVGIVGPSGAGKSTLVQILLRLRPPTSGRYLINNIPSEQLGRVDWQRLVAYVPQDPKLLRGSVAENIRFFRDLDDEAVERAAHLAHIHEEIFSRPGGYQGVIDQRGDTVSGGQRQRICLARALAAKPELLVLDEPTSALDARSETLILRTLRELRGDMTIVVVAHRQALLDVCDQVWHFSERTIRVTFPHALATEERA